MRFCVGLQVEPALGHRAAQARGGEHVLQGLARACVHEHVAHGHDGQAGERGHLLHHVGQERVVRAVQQGQRQGAAIGAEPGLEPQGLGKKGGEQGGEQGREQGVAAWRGGLAYRVVWLLISMVNKRLEHRRGDEQGQTVGQACQGGQVGHAAFDVRHQRQVTALGGTTPRHGDPLRQVAIAAA